MQCSLCHSRTRNFIIAWGNFSGFLSHRLHAFHDHILAPPHNGALGFVDAMNCGFVKFRHDVNSTVEPRYCEHLEEVIRKRWM